MDRLLTKIRLCSSVSVEKAITHVILGFKCMLVRIHSFKLIILNNVYISWGFGVLGVLMF